MVVRAEPRIRRRPLVLGVVAACAVGVGAVAAPAASAASGGASGTAASGTAASGAAASGGPGRVTVVATGLDNPRGLAFDRYGRLYVAEAGHGGTLCLPGGGEEGPQCAGLTSGISVVHRGGHHRLVDGLISLAGPDGTGAEGAVAVAAAGRGLVAQIGLNSRALPPGLPSGPVPDAARRELGRTVVVARNGSWRVLASTGNADYDWTAAHKQLQPDQFPDANPNGLTVRRGTVFVADAGANLVARIGRHGRVTTVAYLPVPQGSPTDGVPTCIAPARDGSLYVGELLGGTAAPGHARVWQVWPSGRARVRYTGLTGIQGCGFGDSGDFYVTEFQAHGMFGPDPHGALVRIDRHGHRTTFGTGALFFPSGFAYRHGKAYVSNWSIAPATGAKATGGNAGQVVAIDVRH